MKIHKNTMNLKCYWVIGVLFDNNEVRFVTELNNKPKEAKWEKGKEPMQFESKEYADSIAMELLWNGNAAVVMEIPYGICITNNKSYN